MDLNDNEFSICNQRTLFIDRHVIDRHVAPKYTSDNLQSGRRELFENGVLSIVEQVML